MEAEFVCFFFNCEIFSIYLYPCNMIENPHNLQQSIQLVRPSQTTKWFVILVKNVVYNLVPFKKLLMCNIFLFVMFKQNCTS